MKTKEFWLQVKEDYAAKGREERFICCSSEIFEAEWGEADDSSNNSEQQFRQFCWNAAREFCESKNLIFDDTNIGTPIRVTLFGETSYNNSISEFSIKMQWLDWMIARH